MLLNFLFLLAFELVLLFLDLEAVNIVDVRSYKLHKKIGTPQTWVEPTSTGGNFRWLAVLLH